jgi:hypothetical protein
MTSEHHEIKEKLRKLIETHGEKLTAAAALHPHPRFGESLKSMFEQIEHNEVLESFWEEMAEEIPDLIEWIQNILEAGGEAVVQAAETVGEVATEVAEVAGEVALETADVAAVVASEL